MSAARKAASVLTEGSSFLDEKIFSISKNESRLMKNKCVKERGKRDHCNGKVKQMVRGNM